MLESAIANGNTAPAKIHRQLAHRLLLTVFTFAFHYALMGASDGVRRRSTIRLR
jgi:hypothetical protein